LSEPTDFIRKPRALRRGDSLAVVAPSSPVAPAALESGVAVLTSWGFQVKVAPSARSGRGYLAGDSDRARADDLTEAFLDPDIAGIVCARGGYGASRLLDKIDPATLAAHPKFFAGFSDITSLHLALGNAGLVTFHGPMVAAGIDRNAYNAESLLKAMTSTEPLGRITVPEENPRIRTIVGGVARGRLVGGNLSLICATMGTPWEIDTRDRIVVLEDLDEPPYAMDRMLTQLLLAGKLRDARGIIFGDSPTCEKDPDGDPSLTLFEVFEDLLIPLGLPLIYGFPCGHTPFRATLPFGIEAEIDADAGTVTILESALLTHSIS
jgi:muramoyltetrapeptide carboxypeptidase